MKKVKIIYVIFLFLLAIIFHFAYNIIPNFLTSVIFPVNESIWEHMKLMYFPIILGSFLEKYLLNKNNIKYNNFNIEIFFKSFLGVITYLLFYLPLYNLFGENLMVSILLLLIIFILMEFIGSKILLLEEYNINIMPIIVIILGIILFGILTYFPPHNYIFFDNVKMIYGLPKR